MDNLLAYHNGGDNLLVTILTLNELLTKTLLSISQDFTSMSKNLDGNLKDIVSGTHIKIHTDAGYVNFYRSANSYEITAWMKYNIQDNLQIKQEHSQKLISD